MKAKILLLACIFSSSLLAFADNTILERDSPSQRENETSTADRAKKEEPQAPDHKSTSNPSPEGKITTLSSLLYVTFLASLFAPSVFTTDPFMRIKAASEVSNQNFFMWVFVRQIILMVAGSLVGWITQRFFHGKRWIRNCLLLPCFGLVPLLASLIISFPLYARSLVKIDLLSTLLIFLLVELHHTFLLRSKEDPALLPLGKRLLYGYMIGMGTMSPNLFLMLLTPSIYLSKSSFIREKKVLLYPLLTVPLISMFCSWLLPFLKKGLPFLSSSTLLSILAFLGSGIYVNFIGIFDSGASFSVVIGTSVVLGLACCVLFRACLLLPRIKEYSSLIVRQRINPIREEEDEIPPNQKSNKSMPLILKGVVILLDLVLLICATYCLVHFHLKFLKECPDNISSKYVKALSCKYWKVIQITTVLKQGTKNPDEKLFGNSCFFSEWE